MKPRLFFFRINQKDGTVFEPQSIEYIFQGKFKEMLQIADYIARVLENPKDEANLAAVRREVEALCGDFPLYARRSAGPG